jgi:beta-lactamase class D
LGVKTENKLKKNILILIIVLFGILLNTGILNAIQLPDNLEAIAAPIFKDTKGAIVIYDLKADNFSYYNKKRCEQQFIPMSTFKIPNSLFALESGVLKDVDTIIPWDKKRDPKKPWWDKFKWAQDHKLRTAIKHSVVWFYQEVARRIGAERMQKLIDSIQYGNRSIGTVIDRFWLDGPIKISANEQIQFLKSFYLGKLGFAKRNTDMVKEILIQEKTDEYTFSAKTGGGKVVNGKAIGWYVGYVERGGNVYFFALNIDGASFGDVQLKRINFTKQVMEELDIILCGSK